MEEQSDDPLVEFGKHLGDLLTYHGVSQSELARKIDELTKDIVSQMIAGSRSRLTPRNMLRFLEGLILLEKITEPETIYWWKQLHIARAEEDKYRPLEEIPKGRELLDLIKRIQEPPQKALEQPLEKSEYRTQQGLPLIGRKQDIKEILYRLKERVQFLTLFGLPGVGKTELAKQVADEAKRRKYFTNVHFLSLEDKTSTEEALKNIMKELRKLPTHKRTLFVLDNLEHLVGIADALDNAGIGPNTLTKTYPQLSILATSRVNISPLHHSVKPLALPKTKGEPLKRLGDYDAVKLFLIRANINKTVLELTEQTAPYIVDLCIGLDGLPLALLMAASWIGDEEHFTSINDLHESLMNISIQKVGYEYSGGVARHISLEALIGWSYKLLDEEARKLFRRLAAFPRKYLQRGISTTNAVALCKMDDLVSAGDLWKLLFPLRKHNFINMVQPYRFLRIAHNTILDYGRRQLDNPEVNEGERMKNHILEQILAYEFFYFTQKVYNKEKLKELADAKGFLRRKFKGYSLFMINWFEGKGEIHFRVHVPKWTKALQSLLVKYESDFLDLWELTSCDRDLYTAWRYLLDDVKTDEIDGSDLLERYYKAFCEACFERLERERDFNKGAIERENRHNQEINPALGKWKIWDWLFSDKYWCLHNGNSHDWERIHVMRYNDFQLWRYMDVQYPP